SGATPPPQWGRLGGGEQLLRLYLSIAFFSLLVAATTGSLLRFGLGWGMPEWATNYTAMRHAHSHLMYFGWATLALMTLIWHFLARQTGRALPPSVHWQMGISAFFALLSFPAFWLNGYGLTQIGPVSLPLGSIIATLNGLTWFYFAWLYRRESRLLVARSLPVQLWDWAILLLLLSAGGALGLVAMIVTGANSLFLQQAFLHLFLDLFAVGWFTMALLGVLWAWLAERAALPRRLPILPLALAIAPTFFLGLSPALLPPPLFWVSALANGLAGLLIFWHIGALLGRWNHLPWLARFGVAMLGVHGLMALVVLWPGVWAWGAGTQLRVYFLHNLLLGWLSSLLLALAVDQLGLGRERLLGWLGWVWIGGVGLMLLCLLGLGLLAFVPFSTLSLLRVAAWSSLIPVAVALAVFLLAVVGRQKS
ncbi:MAG: hypothetical protein KJZ86_06895, partial [Caldilineaceae bacterium]|nr:hypothetical protein [Caldilineaceae bacterium]